MGIIAQKSFVLSQLLLENITSQIGIKPSGSREHKKVIIDFNG
jgi:hypothetical protein